jgi:hypothetical protein
MDKDRRDHVCKLFVQATELLEDAHEFAIYGQGRARPVVRLSSASRQLRQAGLDLVAIADTINAALNHSGKNQRPYDGISIGHKQKARR